MDHNERFIRIEGLTKEFDVGRSFLEKGQKLRAVDNVSLDIKRGETLGLVGESGCGKSTFGRCVLRLIEPTEGKVLYENKDLLQFSKDEMRKMRRKLQMVFQDPFSSLNPARKIGWIMEEPLKLKGIKDKKQRKEMVDQMLVEIGLDPSFANRYARELSGGQRQRISIGLSLMRGEKLIIADEPVSALDVTVQSQILRLLLKLHDEKNLTYMFISHDLNVVHHMCHRVIVMYLGRIVEMADVDEIMAVMHEAKNDKEHPDWFVSDDEEYVRTHIEEQGFVIVAQTAEGSVAGFFLIKYPENREDNLGTYLDFDEEQLSHVAVMDSAVVCCAYRGNGLQGHMLEEAERLLDTDQYYYLMCTIHPDNQFSRHNMEIHGYEVKRTALCYGGLPRCILLKDLTESGKSPAQVVKSSKQ